MYEVRSDREILRPVCRAYGNFHSRPEPVPNPVIDLEDHDGLARLKTELSMLEEGRIA